MHISAIRTYMVQLDGEDVVIDDLFPGEKVHSVTKISEMPRILRVETLLPIQGQANSIWMEPIEGIANEDEIRGSMTFTGEATEREDI